MSEKNSGSVNDSGQLPATITQPAATFRGGTSSSLPRMIFDAEIPEEVIKQIPAQSLHMCIRANGLESSSDLVMITTNEQCAALLDLDLWHADQFNEDHFWEWMSLPDAEDDLAPLQKTLKSLDLKILGMIIDKYVVVESFDEPTEQPPAPGFYTPDKGFTWLFLTIQDGTKHFYLGRLLALVFETSSNVFYQLLALPKVSTRSILEEEAFADRERRLSTIDIPDREQAFQVNAPLSEANFVKMFKEGGGGWAALDIQPIEPLIYDTALTQPFGAVFAAIPREQSEPEISWLMNCALVRYNVPHFEIAEVNALADRVKGAINVGIEYGMAITGADGVELAKVLGFRPIYQLGLERLSRLAKLARQVDLKSAEEAIQDPVAFSTLAGAREPMPVVPNLFKESFAREQAQRDDGRLEGGLTPVERLAEIERAEEFLRTRFKLS